MLLHQCLYQMRVLLGINTPDPYRRCSCRQYLSDDAGEGLVDEGLAQCIINSTDVIEEIVPCRLCGADPSVKNCAACKGLGTTIKAHRVHKRGTDLVANLAKQTPRAQTIEKAHVERSFDGKTKRSKEERARMEVYNELTLAVRVELGAELARGTSRYDPFKVVLIEGNPEPEDNPKLGSGRRYDYGRAI